MSKKKLIVVSNRLPISVIKRKDKLLFKESAGGLAQAMSSLRGSHNMLWIGWPGIASDKLDKKQQKQLDKELKSRGYLPVMLTEKQIENYYDGYSNDTIWPLFHYFQSMASHEEKYWKSYQEVNNIFAKVVKDNLDKNSIVWIHDYHLMMLPQKIRKINKDVSIGFFLHIPFPSYEIFRLLPQRSEIIKGMLGADLVGFHIYDYARHFISSTVRTTGLSSSGASIINKDRFVKIDAFPIGIDYEKFASAETEPKVKKELLKLDDYYKDQKIILSVDRLDYTKGILNRLEAFRIFLEKNPEYLSKVTLIVVTVPSRMNVEMYIQLRGEIEKAISRINGQFGRVDWTPISYQFKNLPFEQVAALFIKSDIALLTPLRDGMNLVAKEFIASKQNKPGALILSEMTGASDELPEAITINPNDTLEIVSGIEEALKIPVGTQMDQIKTIQQRLKKHDVYAWANDFIGNLLKIKDDHDHKTRKLLKPESTKKIVNGYKNAKKRLIFIDYDGTLMNFVSDKITTNAAPDGKVKKLLGNLAKQKNTKLCIVSGRPKETLEEWFGDLPIAIGAEHGAWIKYDGEWSRQQFSWKEYKKKIKTVLESYRDRTPGSMIEEKDFSLVWHYRNVPTELATIRNASLDHALRKMLEDSDFGVYRGAKIIEIKPRKINKGVVVDDLIAFYRPDFTFAIGDDYTDEDMFKALPEDGYSVRVGLVDTYARFQVLEVNDVLKLLKKLT